jgi:hypothetical protein
MQRPAHVRQQLRTRDVLFADARAFFRGCDIKRMKRNMYDHPHPVYWKGVAQPFLGRRRWIERVERLVAFDEWVHHCLADYDGARYTDIVIRAREGEYVFENDGTDLHFGAPISVLLTLEGPPYRLQGQAVPEMHVAFLKGHVLRAPPAGRKPLLTYRSVLTAP